MTFKPGMIVKGKASGNYYTVLDDKTWFSHQTSRTINDVAAVPANYEIVHPKPREPKAGDVVKNVSSGGVLTITADDRFFSHTSNRVTTAQSAKDVMSKYPNTYIFLN